ncbi:hypothetical protein MRB53_016109 [Persea americana]|uniref:Uncharacterized protein n=1 Tax=Persea americana TaxID=3435 RepID=A0ACC2M185_PERAE|nr:hypothetical protein MRB53_016109 [Persea americana]
MVVLIRTADSIWMAEGELICDNLTQRHLIRVVDVDDQLQDMEFFGARHGGTWDSSPSPSPSLLSFTECRRGVNLEMLTCWWIAWGLADAWVWSSELS